MARTHNILLVAEESAGIQMLKGLASTGHEIVAVMTSNGDSTDRNSRLAAVAENLGYVSWPAQLVTNPAFVDSVRSAEIDIILNVHSRYLIHEDVLLAARIGVFNMHPGPLPQYAGLNTVSWAIYRGESSYAVTVHWMTPRIDAGEIAYRSDFPIGENDTPLLLTHKCVKFGVPLVLRLLEDAAVNPDAIPRSPQELTQRHYFGKEIPDGGRLSWNRSAREITNFVRACDYSPYPSPWGYPKTRWEHCELGVMKATCIDEKCDAAPGTVGRCDQSGALVASADEWVLVQQLKINSQHVRAQAILKAGGRLHDGC
jgi:methionyl-tRNA formyltransferase